MKHRVRKVFWHSDRQAWTITCTCGFETEDRSELDDLRVLWDEHLTEVLEAK